MSLYVAIDIKKPYVRSFYSCASKLNVKPTVDKEFLRKLPFRHLWLGQLRQGNLAPSEGNATTTTDKTLSSPIDSPGTSTARSTTASLPSPSSTT